MKKSQIICKNVSLGYEGKIVCEGIDFTVCRGDYLCILGENGAGKSTLIKAIAGLHEPVSGEIINTLEKGKRGIGYLPQKTSLQKDFPATAFEIVMSGMLPLCCRKLFYSKNMKKKALDYMERLEIKDLAKESFRKISGGQQQRVLLARALCAAENLILLDEPVAGLDPVAATEMYNVIKEINRDRGVTVIMVSHDAESVKYASHVVQLGKKIIFAGTAGEYMMSGAFERFMQSGDDI